MTARVFIHGFAGSPRSWSTFARPNDHCLTLPGHAYTPALAGDFAASASHIAAAIRELPAGIELVGYSMGARVALWAALECGQRLSQLTLIAGHPGISDAGDRASRAKRDDELADAIELRGIEWFATYWANLDLFASQRSLPAEVLTEQQAVRRAHRPDQLAAALRALSPGRMPDLRSHLPSLAMPVRLVAGALDRRYLDAAAEMAAQIPRAEIHVAPASGHNPLIEATDWTGKLLARRADQRRSA